MKRLTNEDVVSRLKKLYGDKYNYDKVDYKGSRSYITLVCPIHGDFNVYANNALQGKIVCAKCVSKTPTKEEFIRLSSKAHENKYDYSNTDYINLSTRAIVTCPIHGDFSVLPREHIIGRNGCPKCKEEITNKNKEEKKRIIAENRKKRLEERFKKWKEYCSKKHHNKYNYDLINGIKWMDEKLPIICPHHGIFYQSAEAHMLYGCEKCARKYTGENSRISQKEFEERANKIYNGAYEYGKYKGMHDKMEIICKEHGIFYQTPSNHLKGCGCPYCASSSGESHIKNILNDLNLIYKAQYRINGKYLKNCREFVLLDFVVKFHDHYYVIEYNGIQHYEYVPFFHTSELDFEKQLYRDACLEDFCKAKNYTLLVFNYLQTKEEIREKLYEIFKEN